MARAVTISASTQPSLAGVILDLFKSLRKDEKIMVVKAILEDKDYKKDWDGLTQPMREYAVKNSLKEEDLLGAVLRDRYGKD